MQLKSRHEFPKGSVVRFEHHSDVLRDNPWEDPASREVAVYLPHSYSESAAPFPALWDLAAYTNSGPGHLNWRNHGETLVERLDRLTGLEKMAASVVVIPDCYTSLGGNQYVNSAAVGRYADYLVQELVPFISKRLNVVDDRDGRGVFGKSSGAYGALYLAMHYPECWGAVASLAGDVGFEWVYRPEFPVVCSVLSEFGGDIEGFMRSFLKKNRPSGRDYSTMMILAMAASYDPDESNPDRIRLPFDLRTCELIPERWKRWLEFDPLSLIEKNGAALRSLHALHIEVGRYDQYNILYGSRQLHDRLTELEVDCHYEEFDGTHSAIDWRLDSALPYLSRGLKKAIDGATFKANQPPREHP
jgi:enterochelin esterase-like enzyme